MGDAGHVRPLLRLQRLPVDPAGDHHQHPGEVLRREHPGRLLDQHDLHGSLHPADIPRLLATR